jgi:hypothetical protein
MIMITRVAILSIFVCLPYISLAVEEDSLKDMDLTFTIREDLNEEEAEFLLISSSENSLSGCILVRRWISHEAKVQYLYSFSTSPNG